MFKKSQRLAGCKIECKTNMEGKEDANVSQSKNGANEIDSKLEQLSKLTATLTAEERAVLNSSFKDMEADPEKNGLAVYIRLFQDYPEYKNLWPQLKFVTDSSLANAKELQLVAIVYIEGLRSIVENLEDHDKLADTLGKIAHIHLLKGVKRYHIDRMLPCLLATVRGCKSGKPVDRKIEEAWNKLFDIIATMIEIYKKPGN